VSAKDWTHLTVGVEGAFPPFNLMTPDGKVAGYDVDVANEVCKRANIKCDLVARDWDSQLPSLLNGQFDTVLTMGPNERRRQVIDFSIPYAQTSNSFLVTKSAALASFPDTGVALSVNDSTKAQPVIDAMRKALHGKVVGVPVSTSQQQFIEGTFKGDVSVRTYKSSPEATLDLAAGRIDAQFDNIVYLKSAVAKPGNEDLAIVGPMLTGGVMATDVCFGIRKNEPELKAMLDKAIQSMAADGTLRQLSEKWFHFDISPKG
jgi:lysine-arginine-ornithine-binding protein